MKPQTLPRRRQPLGSGGPKTRDDTDMSIPSYMAATTATQAAQANTATQRPVVKTLGQDDFLKLLTMQMQNQDPMNPQTNTDFVAQMAQFTTLEQSRSMTTSLQSIQARQDVQTAVQLLGKPVQLADGTLGVVEKVTLDKAGAPSLQVGSKTYSLDKVVAYDQPANLLSTPSPVGP
jgi:flagellar basal-body rod modification protein FlgD